MKPVATRDLYASTVLYHLGPVTGLLEDDEVSEILINGAEEVWSERKGRLVREDTRFESEDDLMAACVNVAQFSGKLLDAGHPQMDGRLPDGSRVHAVVPPLCDRPHVAIRKFTRSSLSVADLVRMGSLTEAAARFLKAALLLGRNTLVSGGTGSGKTTLLNVLSSFIEDDERVIVIEETRELQLQKPHVISLEARPPDAHGRGGVSIRDLLRSTLRMRPDRILIGEVRGGEALDLLTALNSGHGGTLSTLHANSPRHALSKLETLAMFAGEDLPAMAIRTQVCNAVHVVVQVARLRDGRRRIESIAEVEPRLDPRGDYVVRAIFELGYARGRAARLDPTGLVPEVARSAWRRGWRIPEDDYSQPETTVS